MHHRFIQETIIADEILALKLFLLTYISFISSSKTNTARLVKDY